MGNFITGIFIGATLGFFFCGLLTNKYKDREDEE